MNCSVARAQGLRWRWRRQGFNNNNIKSHFAKLINGENATTPPLPPTFTHSRIHCGEFLLIFVFLEFDHVRMSIRETTALSTPPEKSRPLAVSKRACTDSNKSLDVFRVCRWFFNALRRVIFDRGTILHLKKNSLLWKKWIQSFEISHFRGVFSRIFETNF